MPGTMTPGLLRVRASKSQRKWLKRRRTEKSFLRKAFEVVYKREGRISKQESEDPE